MYTYSVAAQAKEHTQVEAGIHGTYFLVFGEAGWGYGASVKLLLPVKGKEASITAGIVVDRLQENKWLTNIPPPVTLINAVGGYRKMLHRFFIEPQVGIGFIIETNKADYRWEEDKTYALLDLFPGIESGIQMGAGTFSVSYRLNFRDPFKDAVYSMFSLKMAYRIGGR